MKKLLLLVFAAIAFAACTNDSIEEQVAVRHDVRETITVGFEGDDTRIQLNEAQKTVWTEGDLLSVFYCSTINEQWEFMGETGDRTGQIVPVDNSVNPPATHNRIVVVYPYNEGYHFNTETYNVKASLPAVQHYLKDSYGLNGNILISSSESDDITLKSVCGWLKLQLTGNGEKVKYITFKGNNGEQVAGELYINSADATAVLASKMDDADDNNAGDNIVLDDTILTEVTLDCGEGVTIGAEPTAFYIAIPPQTFEKGFKVEIVCADDTKMVKSSNKAMSIERNTIQPMAAKEHAPSVPNNQIWYTSSDDNIVNPFSNNVFGAAIVSNTYTNGKGVITFDGDVTALGDTAFTSCYSLTSVTIPNSVTTIGVAAFGICYSLTSVTIGDSVTSIGNYAFQGCNSLTSVNIPDGVTTIGNYAFDGCESLTSVTIPDSVTKIGDKAFSNCYSLTEFKGKFASEDGRSLIVDNTIIAYANASGTTYTIPDSVTTIGGYAFYNCNSLTSVTIPDSVTTIGEGAFASCDSLTSVTIGDSVTEIGNSAFSSCDSLTSVTIGDSVTTIGEGAFRSCDSLTEFTGKFAEDNGRILVVDGVLTAFAPAGITEYNIPNGVTSIGYGAFAYCDSLTSVNISDNVTTIGGSAFSSCSSLTSVTIGDSVTTIGQDAFVYCDRLTEFKGKFASEDGRCLIVDGILSSFAHGGLTEYTIPDSVTTIGDAAFSNCTSLTSVNIPDSVTTIGALAFYNCDSLTSVNIPDSVTTIGQDAFIYCDSLTSVNIPDSVTSIGEGAFWWCYSLTSVYCKATTPPALGGTYVFDDNGSGRKIYVPAGSVNVYKSAENWSEYASAIVGYNF